MTWVLFFVVAVSSGTVELRTVEFGRYQDCSTGGLLFEQSVRQATRDQRAVHVEFVCVSKSPPFENSTVTPKP